MVAYAEHQFKLHKPRKGGKVIDQLRQVEKQTGRKLPELQGPPFPDVMQGVWNSFLALNNSRTMATHTANPITFEAMKAYTELTHTTLSPREVEVIQLLDQTYRGIMNKDG